MTTDLMRQLAPAGARYQPVRPAGAAPVCPRRALGGTPAGRRGRVHRVDGACARARDPARNLPCPVELIAPSHQAHWSGPRRHTRASNRRRVSGSASHACHVLASTSAVRRTADDKETIPLFCLTHAGRVPLRGTLGGIPRAVPRCARRSPPARLPEEREEPVVTADYERPGPQVRDVADLDQSGDASTRCPHPAAPAPSPRSASSSTPPRPATPVPGSPCTTRLKSTKAPHNFLPHVIPEGAGPCQAAGM